MTPTLQDIIDDECEAIAGYIEFLDKDTILKAKDRKKIDKIMKQEGRHKRILEQIQRTH